MSTGGEGYFSRLSATVGDGWTRFWFTPTEATTVSAMRLLVGLIAVYLHATLSFDLVEFFGPAGLIPVAEVSPLEANTFSYLNFATGTAELWIMHLAGLAVLVLFAVGLWTRVTSILALVVFLSVVNRGPMITGRTEIIVAMLMLYLCVAPCGQRFSLDALRAAKKSRPASEPRLFTTATIATRLIQVHLCLLLAMMGFSQLGGEVWWEGTGIWFLITRQHSRLFDFTGLESSPLLVNAWSHLIVGYELAFAVLIWVPIFRPLLLALGVLVWGSLALVTGDLTCAMALLAASLAFVRPQTIEAVSKRWQQRRAHAA
jgi:hypothetical protein